MNPPVNRMHTGAQHSAAAGNILAQAIPEAIWDTNLLTGQTYVNDALPAIFGYTAEEASQNSSWWSANLHPADRARVEQGIADALASAAAEWTDVYRFRCSDGSYKTVADRSTIIRNDAGKAIRLVGTMLDITERQRREDALQQALQRYEMLMQATRDAIWDMNLVTGETYTNETLREIFGYDEEVQDNDLWWNSNLHPEDRGRVVNGINAALAGSQQVWKDEYRFRCKNGTYKIILDRSSIIRDAEGKPVRLIGAMQDVTGERILQQALTNQAIVKHQQAAMGLLVLQEQEKEMLGHELHDNINQVLATIKLYIDYALSHADEREKLLQESSGYLNAVIGEIRRLHHDLVPMPLDIHTLAKLLELEAADMQSKYNIRTTVNFAVPDESLLTREKKLLLYRIVQEQLGNVVQHSGASEAAIQVYMENGDLFLVVSDNGKGARAGFSEGKGFANIRNRVQVYDGVCTISTGKGSGFVLTVKVPEQVRADTAALHELTA